MTVKNLLNCVIQILFITTAQTIMALRIIAQEILAFTTAFICGLLYVIPFVMTAGIALTTASRVSCFSQ